MSDTPNTPTDSSNGSNSGAGEWAGTPNEHDASDLDGGDKQTQWHSPNEGTKGETSYHAKTWTTEGGDSQMSGQIFISVNSGTDESAVVVLNYDMSTTKGRKAMRKALNDLENGKLPNAEDATSTDGDTTALEDVSGSKGNGEGEQKKVGWLKRFWRRLTGKGPDGDGFMLPINEDDFGPGGPLDNGPGGPLEKTPYGPVVLWFGGGETQLAAVGGPDVNAWMDDNIQR
ncbi:hypothetical protein [Hasllibacter sp. MH4015]|uniref:hypothetical protein n=1 Tax=Hasllibacter sp. MH4015 TaxID=2854029 RepID=UPI001CD1A322|nr:hypothetical protein [Hasllibacter sp. MH4015]